MLRASGLATDTEIDFSLIADGGDGTVDRGTVPHADLLTRFVEAAAGGSDQLPEVRRELVDATDEATMIDTAATVAAFEMMTRIADGTGTSHPNARLETLSAIREELDLDEYQSARLLPDG